MKFSSIFTLLIVNEIQAGDLSITGQPLEKCSTDPMTGWFRDGYCNTGSGDRGTHVVCAEMTNEFLE